MVGNTYIKPLHDFQLLSSHGFKTFRMQRAPDVISKKHMHIYQSLPFKPILALLIISPQNLKTFQGGVLGECCLYHGNVESIIRLEVLGTLGEIRERVAKIGEKGV